MQANQLIYPNRYDDLHIRSANWLIILAPFSPIAAPG